MKEIITFSLEIDVDFPKYERLYGPRWSEGFKGACDDFVSDMQKFLDGHPFIVGCKIERKNPEPRN